MELVYHKIFLKHYQKRILPVRSIDQAFQRRLELFLLDPYHPLLKDHKLVGAKTDYRAFSVTGDIRVVYKRAGNAVILYDIGTHAQVY